MFKPWDGIRNIMALAALLSIVGGAFWYFARLEYRVASIEAQLQVLHIVPGTPGQPGPLQSSCDKLAAEYASVARSTTSIGENAIRNMMERLGCFPKN